MSCSFQRIRHNKDWLSYEGLMNWRRKLDVVKNSFQWELKVLKCAFYRVVDFYLFSFIESWHLFQMNRPACYMFKFSGVFC